MAFGMHQAPAGFTHNEWQQVVIAEQYYASPPMDNHTKPVSPFLTSNEVVLLNLLRKWHPTCDVFCQVQLMRLVEMDEGALFTDWENAGGNLVEKPNKWDFFNVIRLLSVDFVLCKFPGMPTLAIELDGPEHAFDPETARKRLGIGSKSANATNADKAVIDRVRLWDRDRIKVASLAAAGLPLMRVKNSDLHTHTSLSALKADIAARLA